MVNRILLILLILSGLVYAGVEFDANNDGKFDDTYKVDQNNFIDGSVLAEILDDDGTGSGLDADLLDGQHAAAFVEKSGFTQDGGVLVGTGAGASQEETGATLRTSIGLGSAATRAAEDTLTDGSNLPDGAAIITYIQAGQTGTTADLSNGGWKLVDFMTFYAGENITLGYEVYAKYDTDRLKIYNYDADAADADTYFPIGVAPAAITSGNSGAVWTGRCLLMRRDDFTFTSADLGKPLWTLTTAGWQGTTAPSSAGDHPNKAATVVGVDGVNSEVGDRILYRFSIDDTEVPTP
ncbi:MAG: hypothetical protein HGJ93_00705 [Desulfosarcina sp.]|nr:hypothetical protein [Desulfosarcina sp.]MBC2764506.1 hypothetical protein [Desulfosarcina sp.]